ncbi:MAG: hypothetical protein HEP71_29490 [Roseivirga sp.]|nr:hypothetical protein [Roseivirga sp.]
MKRLFHLTLTLLICLTTACGSDDGNGGGENLVIGISFVTVLDIENNGDASDIEVAFSPSENESSISEYRVILVKSTAASSFDLMAANTLGSTRYHQVAKTGSAIKTGLSASLQDSDGEAIVEGITYRVLVLTVADGTTVTENHLFLSGTSLTLAKTDILETVVELPIGTGGVVVDSEGNVYCADFGRSLSGPPGNTLYKITPQGQVSVFATGFVGASGNTIGADGNIYQSNIQGGSVSKVTPEGQVSTYASGMNGPVGVIFDPAGNLYVANCGDNTVRKVTPEGDVSIFASGAMFNCPNGIAIDNDGNLYVANFSNASVVKVTPEGQSSVLTNIPGNNNGHITFFRNRLYVVARAANQIYELDLQGNSTLIAGSGLRGHIDGPALLGTLSLPNDLGFSPDGKYLYVNDSKPVIGTPSTSDIQPTFLKRIRMERE